MGKIGNVSNSNKLFLSPRERGMATHEGNVISATSELQNAFLLSQTNPSQQNSETIANLVEKEAKFRARFNEFNETNENEPTPTAMGSGLLATIGASLLLTASFPSAFAIIGLGIMTSAFAGVGLPLLIAGAVILGVGVLGACKEWRSNKLISNKADEKAIAIGKAAKKDFIQSLEEGKTFTEAIDLALKREPVLNPAAETLTQATDRELKREPVLNPAAETLTQATDRELKREPVLNPAAETLIETNRTTNSKHFKGILNTGTSNATISEPSSFMTNTARKTPSQQNKVVTPLLPTHTPAQNSAHK
jgi:hypothetical protein